MEKQDWGSMIAAFRRLNSLDGQTIDPKEIMSSNFNKVFQTKQEAIRDARVRSYKKGQPVDISDGDIEEFVDDLVDDLLDRI
tara:strand:+ start:10120 stop:10365 length:246 start_codon:yes stop_codon:yes gene_type:complete